MINIQSHFKKCELMCYYVVSIICKLHTKQLFQTSYLYKCKFLYLMRFKFLLISLIIDFSFISKKFCPYPIDNFIPCFFVILNLFLTIKLILPVLSFKTLLSKGKQCGLLMREYVP